MKAILLVLGVAAVCFAIGYTCGVLRTNAQWRAVHPPTEYDFRIQPP